MYDSPTSAVARPRYVLLDLLRIFAALWVVVFHWGMHSTNIETAPEWIYGFVRAGYLGVDIFFMLSGAVIAYTAIGRTWSEFATARYLRLAPAFVGVTVLTIVFLISQDKFVSTPMNWLNLTGLHFFFDEPSVVSVAWTLYYELVFYTLIAILILITRNHLTEARIRHGVTVFLVVALFAQFSQHRELLIVTLSGFGGMFALGALLGISRSQKQLQKNLPGIFLAACLTYAQLLNRTSEMALGDAGTIAWSLGILLAVGGVILLSALRPVDIRQPRLRASIATFALMTYPLYLLHLEIGLGTLQMLREYDVPSLWSGVIAGTVVLLLSWLCVRYYEPWARKWLRKIYGWSGSRQASRASDRSSGLEEVASHVESRAAKPPIAARQPLPKNGPQPNHPPSR